MQHHHGGAPFKTSWIPCQSPWLSPCCLLPKANPLASSQGQCVFAPAERPALAGVSPTALAQGDFFL